MFVMIGRVPGKFWLRLPGQFLGSARSMYSLLWFDLLFQILCLFKAPVKDILAMRGEVVKDQFKNKKVIILSYTLLSLDQAKVNGELFLTKRGRENTS